MNRLKMKKVRCLSGMKMSRDARNNMLKMKLKLSSVASVGPVLSALEAIGFTEAASDSGRRGKEANTFRGEGKKSPNYAVYCS